MKTKTVKELLIFDADEIKELFHEKTFSIYNNVMVVWDEDEDERILTFLDEHKDLYSRNNLVVALEHEAVLHLYFFNSRPDTIIDSCEVCNDFWTIHNFIIENGTIKALN